MIVEPQSATEQLGSRLEFETLISDISASLLAGPSEQIDLAVERALDRVRVFFHADRSALLSVSADRQCVNVRLASYAAGLTPVPSEVNLAARFPWTRRKLLVDAELIRVSRMADLPPEAAVERENWAQLPIQAALILPIENGGMVTHLMLLQTVSQEREWPDIHVNRLRVLGEMLVSALEKQSIFSHLREAEERVNLAADSAGAGLWALDRITGLCWASEKARAIFDYSSDEVITVECLESSFHPDDRDNIQRTIEQCARTGESFYVEYRILLPGGGIRWVATSGRTHSMDRLSGVSIDITERKRADVALRTSESRLASGADLAGLGFYEVDFATGAMYTDARMQDVCGIPADRQVALEPLAFWMEHLHPDDRERILDARRQLQDGTLDKISVEYRLLHPSRGPRWIDHLAGVSGRDAGGRALRTYGVLRDITERREAEEALRKSYTEIERLKDLLQAESDYLKAEIGVVHPNGEITGQSASVRKVLRMVEQVAPTDSSVLVCGDTGTGKELVAQAIHRLSPRRNRVMVKVNCAALPSGLVESELFGRERGAYTGAMTRQIGRFEVADNSTLFLDEVGELSLDVQSKLLRVLETGEFERLGNPKTIKVNVRLIAATNRDLAEAIKQGKFREDLFYRLSVFPIRVPPLRERSEDIPMLVWTFLEEFSTRMGKKITQVPRKTMEALQRRPWPGNVRELRNLIEHAAIITTGDTLKVPMLEEASPVAGTRHTLAEAERELIERTLERTSWHIKGPKGAAAELGLNPATLYGRMKKLGIRRTAV